MYIIIVFTDNILLLIIMCLTNMLGIACCVRVCTPGLKISPFLQLSSHLSDWPDDLKHKYKLKNINIYKTLEQIELSLKYMYILYVSCVKKSLRVTPIYMYSLEYTHTHTHHTSLSAWRISLMKAYIDLIRYSESNRRAGNSAVI